MAKRSNAYGNHHFFRLILQGKQAHGKAVEPWSLLQNKPSHIELVHIHSAARQSFIKRM